MSKTIQIISTHKGRIRVPVKGESRLIVFEDEGAVGVAMCDHDEAAVLLGLPGKEYWKEAAVEVKDDEGPSDEDDLKKNEADQKDEDPGKPEVEKEDEPGLPNGNETKATLSPEGYAAITKIGELRQTLATVTDRDSIATLVQIEITGAGRDKWIDALNNRLTELK